MNTNGTLVGTRWGPRSAVGPQPHSTDGSASQDLPWRSRRLPATLVAGGPERVLFRSALRRCEGVAVEFADGTAGIVDSVVFRPLGYDFWPEALVVATPAGARRVSVREVGRIDIREPLIRLSVAVTPAREQVAHRPRAERRLLRRPRQPAPVGAR